MKARKRTGSEGRISEQVRAAIRSSGMTRADLCHRTGLEQAALSRFVNRKTGLTLASLDRLAEVLNLDLVSSGPVKPVPPKKMGRPPKRKRGGQGAARGSGNR